MNVAEQNEGKNESFGGIANSYFGVYLANDEAASLIFGWLIKRYKYHRKIETDYCYNYSFSVIRSRKSDARFAASWYRYGKKAAKMWSKIYKYSARTTKDFSSLVRLICS